MSQSACAMMSQHPHSAPGGPMLPLPITQDFYVDEFCPELKVFEEHPWFVPIHSPAQEVTVVNHQSNHFGTNTRHSTGGMSRGPGRGSPNSPVSEVTLSPVSSSWGSGEPLGRSASTTPSACSSTTSFLSAAHSQSVPATNQYGGQYGFQLAFDEQPKDTKSITWTYSSLLKKLFVRMATSCPFKIRTSHPPPPGCVIRAMPIYMKPEHVTEVVRRCPNHAVGDNCEESREHLVRCEHAHARYHGDVAGSGRLSITVPCEEPQAGAQWVTNLYQFMCFSSCVGGLNRRPIQVIFTLEQPDGTVLGRQVVEVRICACPGRDRRAEENAISPGSGGQRTGAAKRPYSALITAGLTSTKRRKMGGAGASGEAFTLTVQGRDNYELLCKIRDSLEIAALMPADFFAQNTALPPTPNARRGYTQRPQSACGVNL